MAVFFLLVGLELKRELLIGELSNWRRVLLPGIAAVGGMLMPALVYHWSHAGDPAGMAGWAIPTATDIAFALAVLTLVGRGLPPSLNLFLLALAVIDDLLAIVVIAIFYSGQLHSLALIFALACSALLLAMNQFGVKSIAPYLWVALLLWVGVLKSGVHATLAGVVTAFAIPLRTGDEISPLEKLEHDLHPSVAYLILPLFGFANAGVVLAGLHWGDLIAPVPLGIALGLLLGKTVGVTGSVAVARLLRLAPLPEDASWIQIIGVSLLCGVGFTMSLFIASLAFEAGGSHAPGTDRLGILLGSLLSAVLGFLLLRATRQRGASA